MSLQRILHHNWFIAVLILPVIDCQHSSPVATKAAQEVGAFSLTLLKESMPRGIRLITITLSRPPLKGGPLAAGFWK